jgi:hypothetical protein
MFSNPIPGSHWIKATCHGDELARSEEQETCVLVTRFKILAGRKQQHGNIWLNLPTKKRQRRLLSVRGIWGIVTTPNGHNPSSKRVAVRRLLNLSDDWASRNGLIAWANTCGGHVQSNCVYLMWPWEDTLFLSERISTYKCTWKAHVTAGVYPG